MCLYGLSKDNTEQLALFFLMCTNLITFFFVELF